MCLSTDDALLQRCFLFFSLSLSITHTHTLSLFCLQLNHGWRQSYCLRFNSWYADSPFSKKRREGENKQ